MDLVFDQISADDPSACQVKCQHEDDCNFWQFSHSKFALSGKNCRLIKANENGNPPKLGSLGKKFTSGPKFCSGTKKPIP